LRGTNQPWIPGRPAPLEAPPAAGEPRTLAEFGVRLRALRDWSQIGPREMPAAVTAERKARGVTHGATKSYTTMFDLFKENRKRYDEDLLFDTIRALLRAGNFSRPQLEELVRSWQAAYNSARGRKAPSNDYPAFRLGPLTTSCQILEGNGEQAIDRKSVRVIVTEEDVVLPAFVEVFRDEVVREQEERRRAGRENFWNGAEVRRLRPRREPDGRRRGTRGDVAPQALRLLQLHRRPAAGPAAGAGRHPAHPLPRRAGHLGHARLPAVELRPQHRCRHR
jgi:hypothetical protein